MSFLRHDHDCARVARGEEGAWKRGEKRGGGKKKEKAPSNLSDCLLSISLSIHRRSGVGRPAGDEEPALLTVMWRREEKKGEGGKEGIRSLLQPYVASRRRKPQSQMCNRREGRRGEGEGKGGLFISSKRAYLDF